ncbi:MAG: O-antigen ligase family protein [Chloroflexota bacterium]
MINWLLLVPAALVTIVVAFLWARTSVDGFKPRTFLRLDSERRVTGLPAVLLQAELPILVLSLPLFLFTSPLTVLGLAVIPLVWGTRRLVRGYFLPSTPLDWPIALMSVMIPVGLLVSPYLSWGAGRAAFLIYSIALYYALVDWIIDRRTFDIALSVYVLAGGAMAVLALIGTDWQYKFPFLGDLTQALPHIANTLSRDQTGFHPNIVAGALLWVVLPLLALLLLSARENRDPTPPGSRLPTWLANVSYQRLPVAILLLLTAATLVLTQSRGAIASAAAGAGLLAWLRWPGFRLAIAIGVVVAVALVSVALTLEISAGKQAVAAGEFSVSAADNFAVRIDTWQSALRAISAHPVEGIGLDAFRHLLPTTYPAASIPDTYDIGHAHNQFLQAALDLGLPGLLAYLTLWIAAGRMLWIMLAHNTPLSTGSPSPVYLVAGFAAALFASFLHGMMDVVVMVSKPGVLFWAMLAFVTALWRLTAKQRKSTLQE